MRRVVRRERRVVGSRREGEGLEEDGGREDMLLCERGSWMVGFEDYFSMILELMAES